MNCGAALLGPFCSACGQRAVAPYPTIAELVGDAWHELSGYDGRFAQTFRLLLGHPGALTIEVLEGRRARYISPVRLYLVASLIYFLCAVAVPNVRTLNAPVMPGSDITIQIGGSGRIAGPSPEDRDKALQYVEERAPWWAKAFLRPILLDAGAFRQRVLHTLPRVLFAIVPVFAAIVALFYRGRRFTQHLIFAVHLHVAVFVALTVRELSQLTRSLVVLGLVDVAAALSITAYSVIAFRRVYRETWARVLVKGVAIAMLYSLVGIAALIVTMMWATVFA